MAEDNSGLNEAIEQDGNGPDMSDLDMNLADAEAEQAVEAGHYTLRVTDADLRQKSEDKAPYCMVTMEIEGYPTAKLVRDFLTMPSRKHLTDRQLNRAKLRLNAFCDSAGIEFDPTFPEGVVGQTVDAILTVKDDPTYGEQNNVKEYV